MSLMIPQIPRENSNSLTGLSPLQLLVYIIDFSIYFKVVSSLLLFNYFVSASRWHKNKNKFIFIYRY